MLDRCDLWRAVGAFLDHAVNRQRPIGSLAQTTQSI